MNNVSYTICDTNLKEVIASSHDDIMVLIIPFSDPIAEEPDIQSACVTSLNNGFSITSLFDTLKTIEKHPTLIFKTYANVVYSYGKERFISLCKEVGVSGLIIPDLPYEERFEFEDVCNKNDVTLVRIVASNCLKRIPKIVLDAKNYIYLSSRPNDDVSKTIAEIQKYTNIPIIKDRQ